MLTPKQRKWLELIRTATDGSGGIYSGERADLVPNKIVSFFDRSGFVDWNMPHNPAHKERLTITSRGRDALECKE